jgi:CRISPR/Cas system CMR-associated protein Cmr1 (group 7 of RAMP superfamily)
MALYSIDEFLKYKKSKEIEVTLYGDTNSISKVELDMKKKASFDVCKTYTKVKLKDAFLDDLKKSCEKNKVKLEEDERD